ncbi:hypothetical protein BDQ17DRAFT_1433849 [Cyathus striatus]|nr:hypothetical protein BDQ17DRAFT_1335781 [Cyathus striatus]KAF8990347.1 hypothetical protein BDQ17DRAFT_1433849 [Cyathus striatus]
MGSRKGSKAAHGARGADKENDNTQPARGKKKMASQDCIRWSDPKLYHLTDLLLTKIEENIPYRRVFGFSCAGSDDNLRKDLTLIMACRELAPIMFAKARVSPDAVGTVANSIKARANLVISGHGFIGIIQI